MIFHKKNLLTQIKTVLRILIILIRILQEYFCRLRLVHQYFLYCTILTVTNLNNHNM